MAKSKPGLPDDFEMEVEAEDFDDEKPVRLGDRIQEERKVLTLRREGQGAEEAPAPATPAPAAPAPQPAPPVQARESQPAPPPVLEDETEKPRRPEQRKAKRIDLSIAHRDLGLLDELVDLAAKYGPQKDVSRAEILSGLIRASSRAIEHLDFSTIHQGRGVKGSATHDAFREEISWVQERAIRNSPDQSGTD